MKRNLLLACILCIAQHCLPQPYSWSPIGPVASQHPTYGPVSGRVLSIAVAPAISGNTPATMFIAVDEAGGIWRSSNFTSASPVWQPLLDKWPVLKTVNYVTVDPSNPRRILAATAAPLVLVSEDSGDNWDTLGKFNGFGSFPIGKIIFDPTDITNRTLYIHGGDLSIYKSTDLGTTWQSKANGLPQGCRIRDLDYVISSDNKITWFASVGYAVSDTTLLPNNIWKSTNGGDSWTKEAIQLFAVDSQKVVNENQTRNITFAFDHQPGAPKGIFAFITNKSTNGILNVFKLTNGTWRPVASNLKNALNFNTNNGLAASSTFQASALSPNGVLYVATGNPSYNAIYQTTNSGAGWASIEKSSNGIIPHPDLQCFAFWDNKVYIGNDGGIYRFTPLPNGLDGANLWESLNTNSLQTFLIDGFGVHPANPQTILVGTQDNGIIRSQGAGWTYQDQGDNAKILFDQSASNQFAYTTGDPQTDPDDKSIKVLYRSDDGGKTWTSKSIHDAFAVGAFSERFVPFALHPANPARIVIGMDRVYETQDRGNTWSKQKSPVFNPVVINDKKQNYGAQATAITYGEGDVIWVAYGGRLLRTVNGGGNGEMTNWSDMNQGVTFGGNIIKIAVDPARSRNVYVVTDAGRMWQYSSFFGIASMQWRDITSNLPNSVGAKSFCLVPGSGSSIPRLVIGTNAGVYISFDNGASWAKFNNNLPAGQVRDVQYHAPTKTLYAGIYGRGIFKTSMATVLDPSTKTDVVIKIPKGDCNIDPVEGSTIQISSVINHPLDNDGFTITWHVEGAAEPAPGETGTGSKFTIVLRQPAAEVTVSFEVQFANGQRIFKSTSFTPLTQPIARGLLIACDLTNERLKPIPWWKWNPAMWRWDEKRKEMIRIKASKDVLKEMEKLTLQYLQEIRKEIEKSK